MKKGIAEKKQEKTAIVLAAGILIGSMVLSPLAIAASEYLQARNSSQKFYLNGSQIEMQAYDIGGNNYVKLRDIGEKVGFAVDYDDTDNSVRIDTTKPCTEPKAAVKAATAATGDVKRASDGTVTLPTGGSNYEPKVDDIYMQAWDVYKKRCLPKKRVRSAVKNLKGHSRKESNTSIRKGDKRNRAVLF